MSCESTQNQAWQRRQWHLWLQLLAPLRALELELELVLEQE